MSSPRLAPWLIPETIRSGRPPTRPSSAKRTQSTGVPSGAKPTRPSSNSISSTPSGERVVMLRAVALRLESGAMTSTSTSSSSTSARRRACSPGAEMPSSLVRRMRTDPILGVRDTAAVATVRLEIEYDGSDFRGWARQPGLRTVQGELETALATVLREPIELTVAGRTDTGVHAVGQVASFETAVQPPEDLTRRLNGLAPDDVAVTAAGVVADGFNARHDAKARSYRYRLLARSTPSPFEQGKALWWPHRIDRQALDACAVALVGIHDFTAFTPTQTDHVRFDRDILGASWQTEGDILNFQITADAFMRNMVRVLVGTQLEVASGRRTVDSFIQLLRGAPRTAAGDTAPPHGLYLESVSYD